MEAANFCFSAVPVKAAAAMVEPRRPRSSRRRGAAGRPLLAVRMPMSPWVATAAADFICLVRPTFANAGTPNERWHGRYFLAHWPPFRRRWFSKRRPTSCACFWTFREWPRPSTGSAKYRRLPFRLTGAEPIARVHNSEEVWLLWSLAGAAAGACAAAIVIPLDWDRPWQVCGPDCCDVHACMYIDGLHAAPSGL